MGNNFQSCKNTLADGYLMFEEYKKDTNIYLFLPIVCWALFQMLSHLIANSVLIPTFQLRIIIHIYCEGTNINGLIGFGSCWQPVPSGIQTKPSDAKSSGFCLRLQMYHILNIYLSLIKLKYEHIFMIAKYSESRCLFCCLILLILWSW